MARKTTKIKVEDMNSNKYDVELKSKLSWGEKENIQDSVTKGTNVNMKDNNKDVDISYDTSVMREIKYVAMETVIESIKDKDGKKVEFSKDWANELTVESGDKLYDAINDITNAQKKS